MLYTTLLLEDLLMMDKDYVLTVDIVALGFFYELIPDNYN